MFEVKHKTCLTGPEMSMLWQMFMESGFSHHSRNATTLSHMIHRCEVEEVSYRLTAHPGMGYTLEMIPALFEKIKNSS